MTALPDHPSSHLLQRLRAPDPLVAVELRPPRTGLAAADSMDLWIDLYHAIARVARRDTFVFLTDNAVGQAEEENLGHVMSNLAGDTPPAKIVPFLTCKHSLEYCQLYAGRAAGFGIEALTVVGGDVSGGIPRCVPHAFQLRRIIRGRQRALTLGGWANPHGDPDQQIDYLLEEGAETDYFLTQIVSHHDLPKVDRFLARARQRGLTQPGAFGVFFYRSANPGTLAQLRNYLPVPVEGITRDFEAGLSAADICARSVRALREAGADKVFVCNLGFQQVASRYQDVIQRLDG